ncbi:MAG: tetratricopeptide repeat protein [Terriglobia bacterium]
MEQHYEKAQAALHSNQSAVAEREFREILRLDPKNASAHANLGVIAYSEKDYTRASQEFRAALNLQPNLWMPRHSWV